MLLRKNQVILFQGDSITDCGRLHVGDGFGCGYVYICNAIIKNKYPKLNLNVINKGISGNTIIDLKNRWEVDCLVLKPSLLTILIGINDCFRGISDEDYENIYEELLEITLSKGTKNIVLMEPFLLPIDSAQQKVLPAVEAKCRIVKRLSEKFNTLYIPLNKIFQKLLKKASANYWTYDGIHPTPQGHYLISESWLTTCKFL